PPRTSTLFPYTTLFRSGFVDALFALQVLDLHRHLLGMHEIADIGEVKRQHGDENEHAAQQGIQEELDGGIFAARSAPDADEEIRSEEHTSELQSRSDLV